MAAGARRACAPLFAAPNMRGTTVSPCPAAKSRTARRGRHSNSAAIPLAAWR
jgi:hypothetical protein